MLHSQWGHTMLGMSTFIETISTSVVTSKARAFAVRRLFLLSSALFLACTLFNAFSANFFPSSKACLHTVQSSGPRCTLLHSVFIGEAMDFGEASDFGEAATGALEMLVAMALATNTHV